MKLYYANASPYARKVRMVVIEKGLSRQIETVACNPFEDSPELKAANPLGKVPTLILNDGSALYDSPVICDYLDSLSPDSRLIPEAGPERWMVLRWQALADGILDSAYNIVMEQRRAQNEQSLHWIGRWHKAIEQSLDDAESTVSCLSDAVNLAHLALISALGYLDFRLPDLAWRIDRTVLAAWSDKIESRPSVVATCPK